MALHYKHWCMKFCVKHTNIHYESLCACEADIVLVYSITMQEGLSVGLVKLFNTTTGRKPHMQDKWEVSPVIKVGIYGCLQLSAQASYGNKLFTSINNISFYTVGKPY